MPTLCRCPPAELQKVQYMITDSLSTGGVGGHGNPHSERLNTVLLRLPEKQNMRHVRLTFKNCGNGDNAHRFCFLHVRADNIDSNEI